MFLKQNVNTLQKFKINWKSNWFVAEPIGYRQHIYEDIFIRKFITSFFFKWSRAQGQKVLGSIHLFRTLGKIYVNVFFFYPLQKIKIKSLKKGGILMKKAFKFSKSDLRPILKCKKQLSFVAFFYQLENILNVQVFFKFRNICNSVQVSDLKTQTVSKVFAFLLTKLGYFRYQFKEDTYANTLLMLVHLFKFKKPDSVLLSNYIARILVGVHKHTHFLLFLKKILQILHKIFSFNGVRVLLSGKLNGFSRAQAKQIQVGRVSFQSHGFPFSEGQSDAFTKAGKLGVKVWIC